MCRRVLQGSQRWTRPGQGLRGLRGLRANFAVVASVSRIQQHFAAVFRVGDWAELVPHLDFGSERCM